MNVPTAEVRSVAPGVAGLRSVLRRFPMSCYPSGVMGTRTAASRYRTPNFQLDVLLYRQGGRCTAHCLQLDLVECGRTVQAALSDVLDVIRAHIEWAIEHDNMEHLFHPAPAEYWKMFLTARRIGARTFRLRPFGRSASGAPRVTVQEASARSLAA